MICFTGACHHFLVKLTKNNILWTSLKRSAGLRNPNERAKLRGIVENRQDDDIFEAQPKRFISLRGPSL